MLACECCEKNVGVAGYAEDSFAVLTGKQASIRSRYLSYTVLAQIIEVSNLNPLLSISLYPKKPERRIGNVSAKYFVHYLFDYRHPSA